MVRAMARDKKNREARVRFALPNGLGSMDQGDGWTRQVPEPVILQALESIAAPAR